MRPLPVVGYTQQSDVTVDAVNENKILEEIVIRRIDNLEAYPDSVDMRCTALARTKIEEAFMWLNRGLPRPQRVHDPDDVVMHLADVIESTVPGAEVSFKE